MKKNHGMSLISSGLRNIWKTGTSNRISGSVPLFFGFLIVMLLTGCGNDVMTLEQAKNQHYAVRVENVDFDVPLFYNPPNSMHGKGWAPPDPGRNTIDAIRIVALLPDMDYYNEKNSQRI